MALREKAGTRKSAAKRRNKGIDAEPALVDKSPYSAAWKNFILNGKDVEKRQKIEDLEFILTTGPDARIKDPTGNVMVNDITMIMGNRVLLEDATLQLTQGKRYGLIGRNGIGKSTLFSSISRKPGYPDINFPPHCNVYTIQQEVTGDDKNCIETVIAADRELMLLLSMSHVMESSDFLISESPRVESPMGELIPCPEGPPTMVYGVTADECLERLYELDGFSAVCRAERILRGLGFTQEMQCRETRTFSGGWRMRLALAQALFVQSDLLLMDEPTNHLDVESLMWLEDFLVYEWVGDSFVVISHDRGFLNRVTTDTIFLRKAKLTYYGGNYDTFVKVRSEQRVHAESVRAKQDNAADHLKDFIARFGHGTKKLARQAQSRMKLLAKMQENMAEVDFDDPYLKIGFEAGEKLAPPAISVTDVSFRYSPEAPILYKDLNFGVDCESRVAIIGPNGAGKSTFLQLLDGSLEPYSGFVGRHTRLQIGRFTQHQLDMLDGEQSPLAMMKIWDPTLTPEQSRGYLSRYGLQNQVVETQIKNLSGGQRSRVCFAQLALKRPHIILLDEPTNHLDIETIEALALAINRFEGGVVVVSHDERFVSLVADEIWVVQPGPEPGVPGSVKVFDGSFEEYCDSLRAKYGHK